jgi:hypothetical protein
MVGWDNPAVDKAFAQRARHDSGANKTDDHKV